MKAGLIKGSLLIAATQFEATEGLQIWKKSAFPECSGDQTQPMKKAGEKKNGHAGCSGGGDQARFVSHESKADDKLAEIEELIDMTVKNVDLGTPGSQGWAIRWQKKYDSLVNSFDVLYAALASKNLKQRQRVWEDLEKLSQAYSKYAGEQQGICEADINSMNPITYRVEWNQCMAAHPPKIGYVYNANAHISVPQTITHEKDCAKILLEQLCLPFGQAKVENDVAVERMQNAIAALKKVNPKDGEADLKTEQKLNVKLKTLESDFVQQTKDAEARQKALEMKRKEINASYWTMSSIIILAVAVGALFSGNWTAGHILNFCSLALSCKAICTVNVLHEAYEAAMYTMACKKSPPTINEMFKKQAEIMETLASKFGYRR